jgi:hypothetical protein
MKVKLKLLKPIQTKLMFVKLVKDCTNLGLKDSKEICEILHESKKIEFDVVDFEKFKLGLKDMCQDGDIILNGGTSYLRNMKILSIGVADKNDYIDFISEYFEESNFDNSKNILILALQKLHEKDLIEIFEKIKEENDSNL